MKKSKIGSVNWGQVFVLAILAAGLFYFIPKYLQGNGTSYKASEDVSHGIRAGNAQSARSDRWGDK